MSFSFGLAREGLVLEAVAGQAAVHTQYLSGHIRRRTKVGDGLTDVGRNADPAARGVLVLGRRARKSASSSSGSVSSVRMNQGSALFTRTWQGPHSHAEHLAR